MGKLGFVPKLEFGPCFILWNQWKATNDNEKLEKIICGFEWRAHIAFPMSTDTSNSWVCTTNVYLGKSFS